MADAKRGKMHASASQLALVLLLIGWKGGANLLSQSHRVESAKPITFRHSNENRSIIYHYTHFSLRGEPLLISPRNDVWEASAEISYWWCFTTQIWQALQNCLKVYFIQSEVLSTTQSWEVTRHQTGISAVVPQRSFYEESSDGVAKCQLFSQT